MQDLLSLLCSWKFSKVVTAKGHTRRILLVLRNFDAGPCGRRCQSSLSRGSTTSNRARISLTATKEDSKSSTPSIAGVAGDSP